MSYRFDGPLVSGAYCFGNRGLGVLGSLIRATTGVGDAGPGYLFNDLSPADDASEVRGLILSPPSAGTFTTYEDGSFILSGAPNGAYTFTYRLYVDGSNLGIGTASISLGVVGPIAGVAVSLDNSVFSGSASPGASVSVGGTLLCSDAVFSGQAGLDTITLPNPPSAARTFKAPRMLPIGFGDSWPDNSVYWGKYPQDILDFSVDWTAFLEGFSMQSASCRIIGDLSIALSQIQGAVHTVVVAGGTPGRQYLVFSIVLTGGTRAEQHIAIEVR